MKSVQSKDQNLPHPSMTKPRSSTFSWYLGGDPVRLALSNTLDSLIEINSRTAIMNLLEASKSSSLLNDIRRGNNPDAKKDELTACPLFGRRFIEGALTTLMGSKAALVVMSAFDSELLRLKLTV